MKTPHPRPRAKNLSRRIAQLAVLCCVHLAGLATVTARADKTDARVDWKNFDALRASCVLVEIDPQSADGEEPRAGGWMERCPGCGQFHVNSLSDALREERPAINPGYLVAPDLVIAPDACVPARFVRAWRVRRGDDTVSAKPVAWTLDRRAMLIKLDKPLPNARALEFSPAPNAALNTFWTVRYTKNNGWKISAQPMSAQWIIAGNGDARTAVPGNSIICAKNGQPLALSIGETIPPGDAWKTSWKDWPWIKQEECAPKFEQIDRAASNTIIHADITLRPLPVRPGENMFGHNPMDNNNDPSATPVPAIVLSPKRVLILADMPANITARFERATLRLPENKRVTARFIASVSDIGAFVVEPETPLDASAAPRAINWETMLDRLLVGLDLRLQGETRVAHLSHTRVLSIEQGWKNRATPRVGDSSETLFLFDLDGHFIGCNVRPRNLSKERWHTPSPFVISATELAAFAGDAMPWADASNIPVSSAEEMRLVWLGIDYQPLTKELAIAHSISDQTQNGSTGVLVTNVYENSPASRCGLQIGDVLLRMRVEDSVQDVAIRDEYGMYSSRSYMGLDSYDQIPESYYDQLPPPWPPADNALNQMLKNFGVGKTFDLTYARDGAIRTTQFRSEKGPLYFKNADEAKFEKTGFNVRALTFESRRFYQIPDDKTALVVSRVIAGSRASVAGLKPYDLIIEVDEQPVSTPGAFAELVRQKSGKSRLLLRRMSQTRIVTIEIDNTAPASTSD
ncbi:hypothetical protein M2103_000127 [Ereboglobus sp. PH5-5]|uniref:PDZ domain-containing protein n=1 Tax=Ereboglobus sp. PH5-5 TaxID=2940529 RepID=UPI002404A3DD|nr:PDZ domain-containing protein [Ereboglobus sp. PH5-5]MDF9831923.1 hypothetical protein [Ereboglobus sp. PH5-5]